MASTSVGSSNMESESSQRNSAAPPAPGAVFFDGASNRRRNVALTLSDALEIRATVKSWRAGRFTISAVPTVRPACCG
jgi:hypothetical protein